jgi:hypothetical protein
MPAVIYGEACLKIACFLAIIYLSGKEQMDSKILSNIISKKNVIQQGRIAAMRDLIKSKASKIPRFSIAKWISKIWLIELNDMPLVDQVRNRKFTSKCGFTIHLSNLYHRFNY